MRDGLGLDRGRFDVLFSRERPLNGFDEIELRELDSVQHQSAISLQSLVHAIDPPEAGPPDDDPALPRQRRALRHARRLSREPRLPEQSCGGVRRGTANPRDTSGGSGIRTAESRVGKAGVGTCGSRWSQSPKKKKKK